MLPQSLVDLLPPSAALLATVDAAGPAVPTGLAELDATLHGGGVPRGRLTEIIGERGSGTTTLLRRLAEETLARSGWVACIDASRTFAPRDWAHLGGEGLWVIRPRDPARAAWCADVLLRCGAFALVILDSAPPLTHGVAVRLTRLARENGAALVVAGDDSCRRAALGGAVRLRVQRVRSVHRGPRGHPGLRGQRVPLGAEREAGRLGHLGRPPDHGLRATRRASSERSERGERGERRLTIVVEKGGGGTHRSVEVNCAIGVARRLCAHPQVPDRRGVARREAGRPGGGRRPAPVAVPAGSGTRDAGGDGPNDSRVDRVLPRKRRCAEPEYGVGDRLTSHAPSRIHRPASRVPRPASRSSLPASRSLG